MWKSIGKLLTIQTANQFSSVTSLISLLFNIFFFNFWFLLYLFLFVLSGLIQFSFEMLLGCNAFCDFSAFFSFFVFFLIFLFNVFQRNSIYFFHIFGFIYLFEQYFLQLFCSVVFFRIFVSFSLNIVVIKLIVCCSFYQ